MRECIFRGNVMLQEDVNPRLQKAWEESGRKGYFPFSAATKLFRKEHCPQINPYGSDFCPYGRDQCTLAYYAVATEALSHNPDNYVAYLRGLTKTRGMDRAERKPLERDRIIRRTDGLSGGTSGVRAGTGPGYLHVVDEDASGGGPERVSRDDDGNLHRAAHRPVRLGDLFGKSDVRSRSRARGRDEGEAGSDEP